MELPSIGKHCAASNCQQLDFLPLQCKCGKVFCSEHYKIHVESCEKSKFLSEDELKKIENVFVCSHADCKEKSIVPLICERCKKHFCVKHRHLTECEDKDPGILAAEREKYAAPVRQFNEAKAAIDKQRCKAHIKQELKEKDVALQDANLSCYNKGFILKFNQGDPSENCVTAGRFTKVHYIRNVQEKIFQDPPPPIPPTLSEMKDSYRTNYYRPNFREVSAPSIAGKCLITGLERPLQPAVPPEGEGYWKYLDIYMTDNKLRYAPNSPEVAAKAREDITTFYNVSGKYKPMRKPIGGPLTGNTAVFDRTVFKFQFPPKLLSRAQKHIPHLGLQSEYTGNYKLQIYSDMYPYLSTTGLTFDESLSDAGPWQNLCPPGMYCSDQCHIGTGWPVRAVIDAGSKSYKPRK